MKNRKKLLKLLKKRIKKGNLSWETKQIFQAHIETLKK